MDARTHTDRYYERELKELQLKVLEMGGVVEKQIAHATQALIDRDDALARVTIERDHIVNGLDVDIDDMCLRLLALHQPAARDLRLIITALKITTDLERIGDMAVNLCERVAELNQEAQLKPYIDLPHMSEVAQMMLRESLNAFVREDTELALKVCRDDDTIDELNGQLFRELLSYMMEDPKTISRAIRSLVTKFPAQDSLFSVTRWQTRLYDQLGRAINHNPSILLQTQDLPPVYEENSCLYIFTRDILLTHRHRIGDRPLLFEIDPAEAWDIDEEFDFAVVDFLITSGLAANNYSM